MLTCNTCQWRNNHAVASAVVLAECTAVDTVAGTFVVVVDKLGTVAAEHHTSPLLSSVLVAAVLFAESRKT